MTTTPTTPTSGAADLLTLIEAYAEAFHRHGHSRYYAQTAAALQAVKDALAAGQATAAPENIRGILARCRDFIDTTKVPAYPAGADLADEIDALLAAQAVVPADLITLRKPTTSAELLWLLKLAHLVISDVDKTLEETFAPAQPAAQQVVAYAALPDGVATLCEYGGDVFTAAQMRAFADATHTLRASHGQAPAAQQAGGRVYAFRRKGLLAFCTCDEARYEELSNKPHLFETRIFYTAPQPSYTAQATAAPAGDWLWVNDLFEIIDAARAARTPADNKKKDSL